MYRGNFGNRFKDREDRNRFTRASEFHGNDIPTRFSAREDNHRSKYGPAEILDK